MRSCNGSELFLLAWIGTFVVSLASKLLQLDYSKVPIIRTGKYASSAVHPMYCRTPMYCGTGPTYGISNRNFRVMTPLHQAAETGHL